MPNASNVATYFPKKNYKCVVAKLLQENSKNFL